MRNFKKCLLVGACVFVSAIVSTSINAYVVKSRTTVASPAATPPAGAMVRTNYTNRASYWNARAGGPTGARYQYGAPTGYQHVGYTHDGYGHRAWRHGYGYNNVGYGCRTRCWYRHGRRICRRHCY